MAVRFKGRLGPASGLGRGPRKAGGATGPRPVPRARPASRVVSFHEAELFPREHKVASTPTLRSPACRRRLVKDRERVVS